ncbi:MAG TPA: hypothetical protein VGR28_14475 [Candidatus Thermoplasmatota archaeon]|jgi:hypothetical protein|nr:hypothetical protein [Candidatus Thermoplasmatota archaeon]
MPAWKLGVVVLLALPTAGCVGSPEAGMQIVASAPRLANGAAIAVAMPPGLFGYPEGTATFYIMHQGQIVYPNSGGAGAPLPVTAGQGSVFVPYNSFVISNGDYEVRVEFQGTSKVARMPVEKWVNWVYALPYIKNGNLIIDVVLEHSPGEPNQRVFAAGLLNVDMYYRGSHGEVNQFRVGRQLQTDNTQDFQRIEISLRSFKSERGYYAAEATFANFEAVGNNWVAMDPTLDDYNPATNWVFIEGPP